MRQRASPHADGFHFQGYASLFNTPDLSGDRVMMGAFARSLLSRGAHSVRMLWNHDPAEPIGVWTSITEDALGLRVEGRLTPGVFRAKGLSALISDGAVDGLSIGFHTVRADKPKGSFSRRLIEVDLWEISLVAFPMQPGARIDRCSDLQTPLIADTVPADGSEPPVAAHPPAHLTASPMPSFTPLSPLG